MKRRGQGIYREGFFKVSRRLLESSLWCEDGDTIKVFLQLVAMSQDPGGPRNGLVFVARKQLAAKVFLNEERLEECLVVLSGTDEESRTQDHDGRRIEVLPNGFRVLNYGLYHDEAKDILLAKCRSDAGRLGGLVSGKSRSVKEKVPSKTEANAKQNEATETETYTETERKTETRQTLQQQQRICEADASRGGGSGGVQLELTPVPKPTEPEDTARRMVAVYNACFSRNVAALPSLREKVSRRLLERYHGDPTWLPWQLIALPILVYEQATQEFRKCIKVEWLLRDGKHPHAKGDRTSGGTDWLERAYAECDRTVLSPPLAKIADEAGVLHRLCKMGVIAQEAK